MPTKILEREIVQRTIHNAHISLNLNNSVSHHKIYVTILIVRFSIIIQLIQFGYEC